MLMRLVYKSVFVIVMLAAQATWAQTDQEQIMSIIERQNSCWNKGDIDCFMKGYWESDSLVYVGSNGLTYGYQNIIENYKKRYADPEAMGQLTFDIKSLKPTGNGTYFMIGGWHLKRSIGDVGGHFTLLWRLIDEEWVIVADHSS